MTKSSNGASADSVALGHYAHVLRTRWRWVALGAALGLVVAVLFLRIAATQVTATATVQIDAVATNPFDLDRAASSLIDPSTERRIAGSYAVAERAAEILEDGTAPEELQAASDVSVDPDGTIVLITFTGNGEREARRGADAVAQSYLDFRGAQVEERVTDLTGAIDARVQELVLLQAEILSDLSESAEESDGRSTAEAEFGRANQEMESLLGQLTTLRGISTSGGQILSPAEHAAVTFAPSRSLVLAAGGLSGLILGLVLAFVRHRTARVFSTTTDVEEITGAPVWGPHVAPSGEPSWQGACELLLGALPAGSVRIAVLSLTDTPSAEAVLADLSAAAYDDEEIDLTWNLVDVEAPVSDRLRAARQAGFAVLIMDPSATVRADVTELVDALQQMRCVVLGTLTAASPVGAPILVDLDRAGEGQASEDQTEEGQAEEGQAEEGQAEEGEVGEGQVEEDQIGEDQVGEDQTEEDQVEKDQVEEGQVEEDQVEEDQVEEGQVEEDQIGEDQVGEDQTEEDQVEEGQVGEGQTEEGQVEEDQVEEDQVGEGQTEEGQVEEGQVEEDQAEEGRDDEDSSDETPATVDGESKRVLSSP